MGSYTGRSVIALAYMEIRWSISRIGRTMNFRLMDFCIWHFLHFGREFLLNFWHCSHRDVAQETLKWPTYKCTQNYGGFSVSVGPQFNDTLPIQKSMSYEICGNPGLQRHKDSPGGHAEPSRSCTGLPVVTGSHFCFMSTTFGCVRDVF